MKQVRARETQSASSLGCALLVVLITMPVMAADIEPIREYNQFIEERRKIPDMGPTPFGESVNLYTGELSFQQTDIRLTGTGPDIVIARTTRTSQDQINKGDGGINAAFGTWDLSIPRIETLLMTPSKTVLGTPGDNWKISLTAGSEYKRCTVAIPPWNVMSEWWRGVRFYTEDGGQQSILQRGPENPHAPGGATSTYRFVTDSQWQISCLTATANGELGEAFQILSQNGTKYTLNYLTGIRTDTITEFDYSTGGPRPIRIFTGRMLARMYVTRMEDRFGNYVDYQYTADKLTTIVASDGRAVSIVWRTDMPVIQSITTQPSTGSARTWQYGYAAGGALTSVTLPDGSAWTYSGALTTNKSLNDLYLPVCGTRSGLANQTIYSVALTAPSGLTGTFTMQGIWHARSYVPSACLPISPTAGDYESNPPLFGTYSLVSRSLAGPGMTTRTWTHSYSTPVASALYDPCAAANTCPDTSWTDVADPDGNRIRYTYSNRWDISDGRLIQTQWYDSSATLLRTEARSYASPTGGAYPTKLGSFVTDMGLTNIAKIEQIAPVKQIITTQQARNFTWQVPSTCGAGSSPCFDIFARPTKVVKMSSP